MVHTYGYRLSAASEIRVEASAIGLAPWSAVARAAAGSFDSSNADDRKFPVAWTRRRADTGKRKRARRATGGGGGSVQVPANVSGFSRHLAQTPERLTFLSRCRPTHLPRHTHAPPPMFPLAVLLPTPVKRCLVVSPLHTFSPRTSFTCPHSFHSLLTRSSQEPAPSPSNQPQWPPCSVMATTMPSLLAAASRAPTQACGGQSGSSLARRHSVGTVTFMKQC